MFKLKFIYGFWYLAMMSLLVYLWQSTGSWDEEESSDFRISEVEIKTHKKQPFELKAQQAKMFFRDEWKMSITQVDPFTSGKFSVQPREVIFYPKSGKVVFHEFNIEELIDIDELVIDPQKTDVSFYDLEAQYQMRNEQCHWQDWKLGRLKSRDLLQHWSKLASFFSGEVNKNSFIQSDSETKTEKRAFIEQVEPFYHVKVGELNIHHSILHFRIGLKNIFLETPSGTLKSDQGRLKLNPLVLTLSQAILSKSPQDIKHYTRVNFYLKTGELKLE